MWTASNVSLDGQSQVYVQELVDIEVPQGSSLGMMVSGGVDEVVNAERGLFVSEIMDGSAAARDGRVKVDDRILAVNGQEVPLDATHEACVDMVRAAVASRRVKLLLQRLMPVAQVPLAAFVRSRHGHANDSGAFVAGTVPYLAEELLKPVVLHRNENQPSFGLAFAGNPSAGIYIAAVMADTPAAAAQPAFSQGLQIVEINGWDMRKAEVRQAEQLLSQVTTATFVLRNNPEGFLPFASDAIAEYCKPLLAPGMAASELGSRRKVVLRRTPEFGEQLGMGIGGPPSDRPMQAQGIFITRIDPNGLAGQDGRLQVGDQILGQ